MAHALMFVLLLVQPNAQSNDQSQTTPQAEAQWNGQIVSVVGETVITRQNARYRAISRGGLLTGDQLATNNDSGASFLLGDGTFVYVGAQSRIAIEADAIRIIQGDARVIYTEKDSQTILMPDAAARLERGAYRVHVRGRSANLSTESGIATVRGNTQSPAQLASYQEVVSRKISDASITLVSRQITKGQEVRVVDGLIEEISIDSNLHSTIKIAQLQNQGVDNAINQRQGQIGDPIANPNANATQGAAPANTNQNTRNQAVQNQAAQNQTAQDQAAQDAAAQRSAEDDDLNRRPRLGQSQYGSFGSLSSTSSGLSASAGIGASGGSNTDANQATNQGMLQNSGASGPFPGNIHLITAEKNYGLRGVKLSSDEQSAIFGGGDAYFSIGIGAKPSGQVTTDFFTGTSASPQAIDLPGLDAHVIKLDQYGFSDPNGGINKNVGITGLLGVDPPAPTINGTNPLRDERSKINDGATFALGEIVLRQNQSNPAGLSIGIRRSDQDRMIVKDAGGNDALDKVTVNSDLEGDIAGNFDDVADPDFFPFTPTVKVPTQSAIESLKPSFRRLHEKSSGIAARNNMLRRAAVTTVLADQLNDFSKRTGNTRFVVDGRIIDISGYKK